MKKKMWLFLFLTFFVASCMCTKKQLSTEKTVELQETGERKKGAVTVPFSKEEAEDYAAQIKEMILTGNWAAFLKEISYPIIVDGLTMENIDELTDYIADSKVNAKFLQAIEAESCENMFSSSQGIALGEGGQIWLDTVQNDKDEWALMVVEINEMFER